MIKKSILTEEKPTWYRFFLVTLKGCFILSAVIVTLNFFKLTAFAAETQRVLTLSEAIQRTFNNHPELQAFQYRDEAQQGRMTQAGLSPKPEVELAIEDALGTGRFGGISSAQSTLSVSWILDQRIKEKRVAIASQGMSVIKSERAIKQLDSAAQTARFFLNALSFQERIIISERAVSLAKETVREVSNRVKIGKTPRAELYRAEAELAQRELVLMGLEHGLKSSLYQLAAQWGSSEPMFNAVAGSLNVQPSIISFNTLKNQISNNPDLTKYLSLERVIEAELRLAKEENQPKWKFSTGIRRFEATNDFGLIARVSVPFGGSNQNQGRIAEMRAKISQNQSETAALRIRMETSLLVLHRKLEHNIHLSETLKKEIIPRLEKALAETHKAYELGKYSYLEWLTVQNDLLDAQTSLLEASLNAHMNKTELERLTGALITSPF